MRDGQILMERPMEMTRMSREKDAQNARRQVRAKEEQLSSSQLPGVAFEASNKGQAIGKGIRKGWSPMAVPES